MIVKTASGTIITIETKCFRSGGEGDVFKIISPSNLHDYCAKIFNDQHRTSGREKKLKFMISNSPKNIINQSVILAWPKDVIYDSHNNFIGFIMPLAFKDSVELNRLTALTLDPKLPNSWKSKFDRNSSKARESRLKLIYNLCCAINVLHSTGKFVLKDFKPDNALATSDGKITMVDMDSIQMCENGKVEYPALVQTPDYVPPEFYSNGIGKDVNIPLDISWDLFSCSVVFYQILLGIHPYQVVPKYDTDGNTVPEKIANNLFAFGGKSHCISKIAPPHFEFNNLHSDLQVLFKKALDGPYRHRPTCIDWLKVLSKILNVGSTITNISTPQTNGQNTMVNNNSTYGSGLPNNSASNVIEIHTKSFWWIKYAKSHLKYVNGLLCGFINVPSSTIFNVPVQGTGTFMSFSTPSLSGCKFFVHDLTGNNSSQNGIYVMNYLEINGISTPIVKMKFMERLSIWKSVFYVDKDNSNIFINGTMTFFPLKQNNFYRKPVKAGFSLVNGGVANFNFQSNSTGVYLPLNKGRYEIVINTRYSDNLSYSLIRHNSVLDFLSLLYDNVPNWGVWCLAVGAICPIIGPLFFIVNLLKYSASIFVIRIKNNLYRLLGKRMQNLPIPTTYVEGHRRVAIFIAVLLSLINIVISIVCLFI